MQTFVRGSSRRAQVPPRFRAIKTDLSADNRFIFETRARSRIFINEIDVGFYLIKKLSAAQRDFILHLGSGGMFYFHNTN